MLFIIGGAIYSSLLMFIEKLPPSEAYPISTFLITICSTCTFYMGVQDKFTNPQNSFIEWDIAIIFCPTLLLGTKFGTILNKSLSDVFLTVFLAVFILHNIKKTLENIKKAKKNEQDESLSQNEDFKYKLLKEDFMTKRRQDSVCYN